MAFQRQDSQQVPPWFMNVSHVFGGLSFRDPEQTEQAHDMVDSQSAAWAGITANRRGNQLVTILPSYYRIGRGKRPVLSFRRECIRWRPDPASRRKMLGMRPKVTSIAVCCQRKIVVQTNGHSTLKSPRLSFLQLNFDVPLQ